MSVPAPRLKYSPPISPYPVASPKSTACRARAARNVDLDRNRFLREMHGYVPFHVLVQRPDDPVHPIRPSRRVALQKHSRTACNRHVTLNTR